MHKIKGIFILLRDVLLEPIILAFALYILFDRFRGAFNKADFPTIPSRVWGVVMDFWAYWYIYLPFFVIVLFWAYWKRKSISEGNSEIKNLTTQIQYLTERIDKLISTLENKG